MHILRFDTSRPGVLCLIEHSKYSLLLVLTVLIHTHTDEYMDTVALPPYNQSCGWRKGYRRIGMLRLIKELGKS